MKLHYSQTRVEHICRPVLVSVPYEITLLSNNIIAMIGISIVSVPYEITLLSNIIRVVCAVSKVSVPYEITLLSNVNL